MKPKISIPFFMQTYEYKEDNDKEQSFRIYYKIIMQNISEKRINMKKQKGITLVSLVITIIISIILAGISLNVTIGDGGIITKAQQAKENIRLAQEEEQKNLNVLYSHLDGIYEEADSSSQEAIAKLIKFKKIIAEAITLQGVPTADTDEAEIMASHIGKIIKEKTKNATATPSDILKGKTAWVNGEMMTGIDERNTSTIEKISGNGYNGDGNRDITYSIEKSGTYLLCVSLAKSQYHCSSSGSSVSVTGYENMEVIYDNKAEFGFENVNHGTQAHFYCSKIKAIAGTTLQINTYAGNGYPIRHIVFLYISE